MSFELLTIRKRIRIWITADVTQLFDCCLLYRIPKGHISRHLNIERNNLWARLFTCAIILQPSQMIV